MITVYVKHSADCSDEQVRNYQQTDCVKGYLLEEGSLLRRSLRPAVTVHCGSPVSPAYSVNKLPWL